ncbi:hypothetical protein, partial [uncultured Kriegella sp.]|uniref:hypothetical protein n=1 Tax=uncultured Kriegella sp. TaxID=1798910 RepID=UPI0030DA88F3
MRTLVLPLLFVLFVSQSLMAQIKIGDNPQNLDPASVLELESTERVLVITRIDSLQMNAIVPQRGALVYNTDANCVHYFDGTAWRSLCETSENGVTANPIVNETATIVITPDAGNFNVEIAPSSISTEHIADGSINGIDLQNNSIGGNKLANTSVTRPKLSENAVGVTELATDEIDLALFENGTGFIRDNEVVSGTPGNVITNNAGAFYDDSALQTAIATNTANIAADGDTNATNELQILEITGDQLTISGRNTITLPTADGSDTNINAGANIVIGGNGTAGTPYVISADDEVDGSITNEIQTLSSPDLSVTITPTGPNNTDYLLTVPPTSGADGSETVIDATSSTVGVTG